MVNNNRITHNINVAYINELFDAFCRFSFSVE